MNGLVEYRMSGDIEWVIGDRRLDLSLAHGCSAVDQGTQDSVRIGFLTPIGRYVDIEPRLAQDDAVRFGTVLSAFVYLIQRLTGASIGRAPAIADTRCRRKASPIRAPSVSPAAASRADTEAADANAVRSHSACG